MADQPFPFLLVPVLIWVFRALLSRRGPEDSGKGVEAPLIEAEDLVLTGQFEAASKALVIAAPVIDRLPDSKKHEPLARLHLLEGLIAQAEGKAADAEASFQSVRALVPSIANPRLAAALEA